MTLTELLAAVCNAVPGRDTRRAAIVLVVRLWPKARRFNNEQLNALVVALTEQRLWQSGSLNVPLDT
jgi:hypothetical protein